MTGIEYVFFLIGCYAMGWIIGKLITKTKWFKRLGDRYEDRYTRKKYYAEWVEKGRIDRERFGDINYRFTGFGDSPTSRVLREAYNAGYDNEEDK